MRTRGNLVVSAMNVQVVSLSPIKVAMIRHVGPYERLQAIFNQLFEWVEKDQVPIERTIGIYWDNPEFTEASQLRSAACVEVPHGYQLVNTTPYRIALSEIMAGDYATTTFTGPYEDLEPVWAEMISVIENQMRREISVDPAFEVYVNDPMDVPPSQLITELYMPIR